jgi:hypothetical protein
MVLKTDDLYAHALDFVLTSLSKHKYNAVQNDQYYQVVLLALSNTIKPKFKINEEEYNLLLEKLYKDEMVANDETENFFTITFKGVDWIKRGGYVKENRIERNKNLQSILTNLFLIFGSIATVIIAVIELIKFINR